MKRVFYHGTSADNLESILRHGLSCDECKLWNVSDDLVYLWDVDAVAKAWDLEDSDPEEREYKAFKMAAESAQMAITCAKDCRAVVLKIEIDDSEIEPDLSSENMVGQGAVCINRAILPEEIVEVKISNDLSLLKGYFISMIIKNKFCGLEFTNMEKRIAKAFENSKIYLEDIEDMMEWEIVEPHTVL